MLVILKAPTNDGKRKKTLLKDQSLTNIWKLFLIQSCRKEYGLVIP